MMAVKDLSFKYPGNKEDTLKSLNFTIGKGEIFGFLGPSGAGKSTTQKILIGILKNYRGKVAIMGKELSKYRAEYYEKIGVAFEFPNLYSKFTALENLEYFRSLYADRKEDPLTLLKMVGLADDARVRVSNYSKGMKVRLNFCRALLNKPEILFLDEPTSGLDPVNAKMIKNIILAKKAEGTTIFLTTHNMSVAADICDKVAFIIDGKISLIDSPRKLMIERGKSIVRVEYKTGEELAASDFQLKGIGANQQFIQLLRGRKIETIHTLEASLEEIFIETTGRGLNTDETA